MKALQSRPATALIAGIALTLGALGALVPVGPALAADADEVCVSYGIRLRCHAL